MILQSLCLSTEMPAELYYRGEARVDDGALSVGPGGAVSFDTYFNMFSAAVWRRYTSVEAVTVKATVEGEGEAVLFGIDGDAGQCREICRASFSGDGVTVLTLIEHAGIDALPGHVFLRIEAGKAPVRVRCVDYIARPADTREIRLACCFCTYRREKDILRNIERLCTGILDDPASPLHGRTEIYVADNGHTLCGMPGVERPGVKVFENVNAGGAAGFTRCMIEAVLRRTGERFTHVILMDDDAVIEPCVIERTGSLLACLRPEHRDRMVGGAMLYAERPGLQMENGSFVDPKDSRMMIRGLNRDLTSLREVLANEADETPVNYNAWYYCCIPAGFIREDNLPLPLFIHIDDQEYGLRNPAGLIHMNGICIWHPDPWKRTRPYMEYYNLRNRMILLARINPGFSPLYICLKEAYCAVRNILNYRYDEAQYRIMGYMDYYKGPEWFRGVDAESLNRQVMSLHRPRPCKLSAADMARFASGKKTGALGRKIRKVLNQLMPAFKGDVVYDVDQVSEGVDPFGAKRLHIVDVATGEGITLEKSYRRAFEIVKEVLVLCAVILTRHGKVHAQWGRAIPEMSTLRYWERYLKL